MLQLIMIIWILAGTMLIDDMSFIIDDLSIFAQVMVMLVLTIFAPVIWLTLLAEDIINFIIGGFDDDG